MGHPYKDAFNNPIWSPDGATHEAVGYHALQRVEQSTANSYDVYAFPFIYPGMYSVPDPTVSGRTGSPSASARPLYLPERQLPLNNHSPLDIGDNLPGSDAAPDLVGLPDLA